jgi:hypothetical protein
MMDKKEKKRGKNRDARVYIGKLIPILHYLTVN